ncbi:MAG: stage V sporulation protein AD [Alicyclobacillus sp.]|nr:stage V sporulation protein AD [Alicyclobacillus sp.]
MPKVGRQTWVFPSAPGVIATGTVAGKVESEGPLGACFDVQITEAGMQGPSWEKDEQALFYRAAETALRKANLRPQDLDLVIGGDLNAQLTGFYYGLREIAAPKLGVYSACSTFTESVAVAALALEAGFAERVLIGACSHNSSAERQFRFPTEYGVQKPATAQRTVTGAGAAVLSQEVAPVVVTAATIGEVVDYGITDAWEYGAAMAPAAAHTIGAHLTDTGRSLADFDCIATGDLGRMGHALLRDLLGQAGHDPGECLTDCGLLIFRPDQPEVMAGGSGAACSALVTLGHLLEQLKNGSWQRILVCATGALLSQVMSQQKETIPSISHAIVFERREVNHA